MDTPGSAKDIVISGSLAFVADDSMGLQIIDISNPTNASIIGFLDTPGNAEGIFVSGSTAYVADGARGLQIIDISAPQTPVIIGNAGTPGWALDVVKSGTTAYVADAYTGLQAINVGDPANPAIIGSVDTPEYAARLAISGTTAYVADGMGGLQIIDIAAPTAPVIIGSLDLPGSAYDILISGTTAYVGSSFGGVQLVDISDPTTPAYKGYVDTPDNSYGVALSGETLYVADRRTGLLVIALNDSITVSIIGSADTPSDAKRVKISGGTAYVADGAGGLRVIDITDPAHPGISGFVDTPGNATSLDISGTTVYLSDGLRGLQIINVGNPSNPAIIGTMDTPSYALDVVVSENLAYVADGNNGLQVINVGNPASPAIIGSVDTPGYATGIALSGTVLCIGDGSSGLHVIDVSDPTQPVILGSVDTPGSATEVALSGATAYVADGGGGLQIIDITNPANPTILGSAATVNTADSIAVSGGVAYLGDGNIGVLVIDIGNPAQPVILGAVTTLDMPSGLAVDGNYVYSADGNGGLVILTAASIHPCQIAGYNQTEMSLNIPDPQVPGRYSLRVFNDTESAELNGAVNFYQVAPVGPVTIFFEDFEGDTSEWVVDREKGRNNDWFVGGTATFHTGSRSAYVSGDNGVTAGYVDGESTETFLNISIDLRIYKSASLSFWWKSMGYGYDYGELYVYDGITEHLISAESEFRGVSDWRKRTIDLSAFAGKEILIKFKWRSTLSDQVNPGFCVDNVSVTGMQSDEPVFISAPVTKTQFQTEYRYSVTTFEPNGDPLAISAVSVPAWISLINVDSANGTADLTGTPGVDDLGTHNVILEATNGIQTVSQQFSVQVAAFYEGFESDVRWSVIEEPGTVNSWIVVNALAKTGDKSGYISDDGGVTAGYEFTSESESTMAIPVDLTFFQNSVLTFQWLCESDERATDGVPIDYGEVYIDDGQSIQLVSEPSEFLMNRDWREKSIDLSSFSGKPIVIHFYWNNQSSVMDYGYSGFAVDDIMVTGDYSILPIFSSNPKTVTQYNLEYTYPVTTNISGYDTTIQATMIPGWLSLTDMNPVAGTATLTGTPGLGDLGTHQVVLEATNSYGSSTLTYTITVAYYYEDFENDVSEWTINYQPGTENIWHIGTAERKSGENSAFITNDSGVSSRFWLHHRSESVLEFPIDLTYVVSPSLRFFWKFDYAYFENTRGYGEIYIIDIDGSRHLVSEEKEFSDSAEWVQKTIDLSDYAGKSITIQLYWYNNGTGSGDSEALCIDDVEIVGAFSVAPVVESPMFTSTPETTDTSLQVGQDYAYSISTLDNNGDNVNISVLFMPDWLSLENVDTLNGTAVITGTPGTYDVGESVIVIEASDGIHTSQQSFPILVYAKEIYRFERTWPILQQPWYFMNPRGIAMDGDGNIYVSESGNNRIQKFNANGQFVTSWGSWGDGPGQFNDPDGIDVGPDGYIYVVDSNNHRIQKFTPNGDFIETWGEYGHFTDGLLRYPRGIAVDNEGNVYVADTNNSSVQKFTSDGEFLLRWEIDGILHYLWDVAVDESGYVYLVDSINDQGHCVQKYTSEGEFVTQWGSYGAGYMQFDTPFGITVANNEVYVADALNGRIQKFDLDGGFLGQWNVSAPEYGEIRMANPYRIAVNADGFVFVTDNENNSVKKFDPDGQLLAIWGSYSSKQGYFGLPQACQPDANGNVYVADRDNNRIQMFNSEGMLIGGWGNTGTGEGEFNAPTGLAIDTDGNIYVVDRYNHRIQVFTPDGDFIRQWGSYGTGEAEFNQPVEVAIDGLGNVYVTDWGNNRIQKFDPTGLPITRWGERGVGIGQFDSPNGLAIDESNNVYVVDSNNDRVQKFDEKGTFITQFGASGFGEGELFIPIGIAIDGNGDVFVGDYINSRIQKFSSSGEYLFQIGEHGFAPGQIYFPSWIAFDPFGKLYAVDFLNNSISSFQRVSMTANNKAIIVAGGQTNDVLGDEILSNANYAYRALVHQGFNNQDIVYLSSSSHADVVDGDATLANLQNAIRNWDSEPDSLVVYLVDHGGYGTFRMNDTEILTSADLNTWLNTLQSTMTGNVIVVYDACRAATFLADLTPTNHNRIVIASTSEEESAYFTSQGENSFSNYFWSNVFNGKNLRQCYEQASMTGFQTPRIYINRDGVCTDSEDPVFVTDIHIGNGTEFLHGCNPNVGPDLRSHAGYVKRNDKCCQCHGH